MPFLHHYPAFIVVGLSTYLCRIRLLYLPAVTERSADLTNRTKRQMRCYRCKKCPLVDCCCNTQQAIILSVTNSVKLYNV